MTEVYEHQKELLDGQALKDIQTFIRSDNELAVFAKVCILFLVNVLVCMSYVLMFRKSNLCEIVVLS